MSNSWNPQQYEQFETERSEPFYDLTALIQPAKNMKIVDLGCGTGMLTAKLHDLFKASQTLGIDSSKEMLQETKAFEKDNLKFEYQKIEDFHPEEKYDLIFANASLQWVQNHAKMFFQLHQALSEHGQIAIQMPSNYDYPTHTLANELASEAPYATVLGEELKSPVLRIEDYSNLLYSLGFSQQIVRAQVYAHVLDSTESVIEWVRGSLLTYYKSRLSYDLYNQFLKTYRKRLLDKLGWSSPFFFPTKRILIWAKKNAKL